MIKIYNTLSQSKETFEALKDNKVNLFVCGPTVYDFSHIGHARTYVIFDVIVKYLRSAYDVFYLQNITDIDDKIIQRAKENNTSPEKLAKDFENEYMADMQSLKIDSISEYARATDHIKEIISQVERLLDKGFAYEIDNDGVYYDISKFQGYGKLAKRTITQAEDGVSRIDESIKKRNKGDFCLWKFSKPDEPQWPSPWGQGRPGWHIEDTAITEKYFGSQYDAHGGARDLIFPHHEAEISQMEAISDKAPLVRYWLHSGFLTVNGQKMSKSLGNFITIRDFLKNESARLLRYLVVKNHYRSPIDYNDKLIAQAKKELEKIDDFVSKLEMISGEESSKLDVSKYENSFKESMDDDFNTPKAIAVIFELMNEGNSIMSQKSLSKHDSNNISEFLKLIDTFFGFIFSTKKEIPVEVVNLARERKKIREEKKWKESDKLREEIRRHGYTIEDTDDGFKLKRV